MEQFFDLVFVLAIAELARYLHDHLTVGGFLAVVCWSGIRGRK
jgi:low temperature requirement protein LtrA